MSIEQEVEGNFPFNPSIYLFSRFVEIYILIILLIFLYIVSLLLETNQQYHRKTSALLKVIFEFRPSSLESLELTDHKLSLLIL